MQTNLNKKSNFFERTLRISSFYGYSGIPELSKALGYKSPEKLYRLQKENTKPSVDILQDLSNKFEDLNLTWYITGNGEMIISKREKNLYKENVEEKVEDNVEDLNVKKTSTNAILQISESEANYKSRSPSVVTVDSKDKDNIVLVPIPLSAGYLEGYNDPKFISNLPSYRMPGLNNGVFRMFEVEGNSMYPTLPNKSYVVGQFVENWIKDIKDNQIYAVISNEVEGGLVKRCLNKIKKYDNLICKSDNRRNYPAQNISPESIKEIWEIKLHLNFHLPDPADIYDQIYDLQGEVSSLKGLMKDSNLLR